MVPIFGELKAIDRKTNNTAIFDGEAAVPDQRGVTHIDNLTMARHAPERLAFFAFDLLVKTSADVGRAQGEPRQAFPSRARASRV